MIFCAVYFIMTQVDDNVKIKLILQLIKGISRVLQGLHASSNGAAISTPFILPSSKCLPYI